MLITKTSSASDSSKLKKNKSAISESSGFSDLLASGNVGDGKDVTAAAAASINELLFLQEVDANSSLKQQIVANGFDALDYLDKVKMKLLSGALSEDVIVDLENIVAKFKDNLGDDPKLKEIIDEIDLRAQVELAKIKKAK